MSVAKKFKFKKFKRTEDNEVVNFEGFRSEDISYGNLINTAKTDVIYEEIKINNPDFIINNVNISDFEGFCETDIDISSEINETFDIVYQKWLTENNLYLGHNDNMEDFEVFEPIIIKEDFVQEINLKPKQIFDNFDDMIQQKTHVFIKIVPREVMTSL